MKFPFCICLFPLVFALFHPALTEETAEAWILNRESTGKPF